MKKQLLMISAAAMIWGVPNAQQLRGPESENDSRECYVAWPSSYSLDQYINQWTPGKEIIRNYGSERGVEENWEDEEFFISRVKLRPLISNVATQVYEDYVGTRDKKLLYWVPCGMSGTYFQTGSLPNGVFNSDVFSTWSYVTHYGNWASPYGWVPGGFADAAHKHGVMVSGVAAIPQGKLGGSWLSCLAEMANMGNSTMGVERVGRFLRYHGVDGLGYYSEFSGGGSVMAGLRTLHGGIVKYMKEKGQPGFENPWYSVTNDEGEAVDGWSLAPDSYQNFGYAEEPRTIMFVNNGWINNGYLESNEAGIEATGRDPRDLYLGMNMQEGIRATNAWEQHDTGRGRNYSIGVWGKYSDHMLFPLRKYSGENDIVQQQGYQKVLEQWFTNGKRNPACKMEVEISNQLAPGDNFQGMSRHMNARSAYGWDLSKEPFITYFSLGNGRCYRMNGEIVYPNEWYNIGMQDYTPTWRWWWAETLLGKEPSDVPANSMTAEFCWDDAWNGGSSLKVSGSTSDGQTQYLHLFKTQFEVKSNDIITIRYKLLKGNGDINFVYTMLGEEVAEVTPENTVVHTTGKNFFYNEWNTVELRVSARGSSVLTPGEWALIGLKFANARDLEVLIGEVSIKRGNAKTPDMPVIRRGRVLGNVMSGLDAKLVWKMPNTAEPGEPVYNADVNVSHFELWAQVENSEPQFMGTTTSWAGLMFKIKNPELKSRVRLGVQAVSLDHNSKSGIRWMDEYLEAPEYEVSEEVKIDKSCIKPDEQFRIWFVDDKHNDATLSLYSKRGEKVASNNGTGRELVASLYEIGAYDLVANEGTNNETRYRSFAQVSDFSVGCVPKIETLLYDGIEAGKNCVEFRVGTELKAGYTGRSADGTRSRALMNDHKRFGAPIKDMKLGNAKSFSVSFWVRPTYLPEGKELNLFGIEDISDKWPENNWGYFWTEINSKGEISAFAKRRDGTDDEYHYEYGPTAVVPCDIWTHVTIVFDYNEANALLMKLYLNGAYQEPLAAGLKNDTSTGITSDNVKDGMPVRMQHGSGLKDGMWMHIFGGRGPEGGYPNGMIDDMTVWEGVVSEADIANAMTGLDADRLPENVKCFWDFENEPEGELIDQSKHGIYIL